MGVSIAALQRRRSSSQRAGERQRSHGVRVVCTRMCVQEKRCVVLCGCVLQRGQRGEGWDEGLILCRYSFKKGDLLVRSCASVLRVRLSSCCSESCTVGGDVIM